MSIFRQVKRLIKDSLVNLLLFGIRQLGVKAKVQKRVVVTGIGAVSPSGIGVEAMWKDILEGQNIFSPITGFDTTGFDVTIAGEIKQRDFPDFLEKKKLKALDPFVRYALVAAKLAVKDAGFKTPFEIPFAEEIGVLVGSGIGGLSTLETQLQVLIEKGPRKVSPRVIPMIICDSGSGEIANELNAKGPNFSVISACASGLHSLGTGFIAIKDGYAKVMICGGTEASITKLGIAGFSQAGALSLKGISRPFDKERDGFVMAEGAGVLVLEEYEHAVKRDAIIYAEICGFGMTDDAHHSTSPPKDGNGIARAMRSALIGSEMNPEDIDYVNPHAPATFSGDPAEATAIKEVFRGHRYLASATKSILGHTLGAAGALETIVCILSMRDGLIHPTYNLLHPDDNCDIWHARSSSPLNRKFKTFMKNSCGFGGHNAVIVARKI